jgi:predicted AAA+ superfamily ATPase
VSLEELDNRDFAETDPRAFLKKYNNRVIFDEVQRVPSLLSYIQGAVDQSQSLGQFVLTGSHQLLLREGISQSLAGRTSILNLLPLSISEMKKGGFSFENHIDYIFNGFLPRIYDQGQRPKVAYSAYYQTYVERDVRQLIALKDAALFDKFMRLLAGRVGQLFNAQSLANDVGVDGKTIANWLSILEASFIIFKLPQYFENFGKRVIKSPKYYFTDTGLLCFLLGIESTEQVERDPLVGNLFENLIVMEVLKNRFNQGLPSNIYFFRDAKGNEVDIIQPKGRQLSGFEVKSSSTWHNHFKKALLKFSDKNVPLAEMKVVYAGSPKTFSDGVSACHFSDFL